MIKKILLSVSFITIVLFPTLVLSAILFNEDFESGVSPFRFDAQSVNVKTYSIPYNEGSIINEGGDRGRIWREIFKPGRTDTYFGFRKSINLPNRFYFRLYIRYGDSQHPYTWGTASRSHELKFPDINPGGGNSRVYIKHRYNAQNNGGVFRVYTPGGGDHDLPEFLVSNRWYCIEFMLEDNGSNDTVKLWLNKNNESDHDYAHYGSMFNSDWSYFSMGYRNHEVSENQYFYIDDVTIADTYIGCGPVSTDSTSPHPPHSLTVAP